MEPRQDLDGTAIWQEGDPWVDLAPALHAASAVTVVTANGTARLMWWSGDRLGCESRHPLEGGHVLHGDATAKVITNLYATPCGLRVTSIDGAWSASTPLRLVLRGLHREWIFHPTGREVLDRVLGRQWPTVPSGHPGHRCDALHCLQPAGPPS